MIKNLIYILQKENYDIYRFLSFVYSHLNWRQLEKRQKIVWTIKVKMIYLLSWILIVGIVFYFVLKFGIVGFFAILGIIIFLPFIIIGSLLLLLPVDIFIKNKRISQAKEILQNNNLIVIGITGSYGKTSTKEILSKILESSFKVIKTSENVNTDIGIADFITKNKKRLSKYDVFIVEMGAYKTGDIIKICNVVSPKYSILTGINSAHLEKFGSLDNIIKTKFELPENTKKMSVLNFNDENIKDNYKRFNIKNICIADNKEVKDVKTKENFGGIEFNIGDVKLSTRLLALHNIDLIYMSIKIAEELGMKTKDMVSKISEIEYTPHRLSLIYNSKTGIYIIDDSYNGNVNGIKSGIKVLSRARGRKVVLTPGLVELGKKSKDIHSKIGQWYADETDLVLLIDNEATRYIVEILNKNNFKNYIIYKNAQEAHNALAGILRSGDTIIFQNDLSDNYL